VILVAQKIYELDFTNPHSSLTHGNYDINLFCNKILSQNQINDVLNKVWPPEINYKFPTKSITSEKDKKYNQVLGNLVLKKKSITEDTRLKHLINTHR
jgi:hypothetical protein